MGAQMSAAQKPVALITGASSGIGHATALIFAREGVHTAGTARRAERLQQLKQEIDALPGDHGDFLPITADVRDREAIQAAVDQVMAQFGRLDILVANAGVGHRGAVVDADWNEVETLLRTNIDGVLHSIRAAVPAMRQGGRGGHIIIVSSVIYNMTAPYAAYYAASKAFVSSLARSLRLELAEENIRVSDMLVGRTATEFNEKRLGNPGRTGSGLPTMTADQVAQAIVKASRGRGRTIALRWFDRFTLLGSLLVPGIVGRLAMRQYRVK
jgi:3-hydroxy acid dehydrogenase / malonic semialdehyde reductase